MIHVLRVCTVVSDAPANVRQVAPKIPEPGPEAGFGPEMHKAGQAEAAGMATGGGGISPHKRGFATRAGAYPNPPQALSGARAAAGLPARSFAGRMGLSFIPSPASGWGFARRMSTPGGPDDSMHNPPDAGWTPADRGETGGRPSVGVDDVKEFAVRARIPEEAAVGMPEEGKVRLVAFSKCTACLLLGLHWLKELWTHTCSDLHPMEPCVRCCSCKCCVHLGRATRARAKVRRRPLTRACPRRTRPGSPRSAARPCRRLTCGATSRTCCTARQTVRQQKAAAF